MAELMAFQEGLLIAPVTALHFVQDNILLAGEGPILRVYNVDSEKQTSSAKVLSHASIHGIKSAVRRQVEETHVCVFGCKSVHVISLLEPGHSIHCRTDERDFNDWIWDVQWLQEGSEGRREEDSSLALALGHNSVAEWQWKKDVILHHIYCEETCILYCAKFIGTSWHSLVLAAGTVFNQVALWPVGGHVARGKRAKVLHRLTGHQGVIFAIDFHEGHKQICSASDDRSIRLWQLRCHGDGDSSSCDGIVTRWDDVSFEELRVFYGHSARVWGARLLSDHIVSVGEDATCVVWNYNGDVVEKFKGHKGKSIWSLAVNPSEAALATGGGDSSVRLWRHLKGSNELNQHCHQRILSFPQGASSAQPTPEEEDFPRSIHLLTGHCLLTMTNAGCLWLHELTTGQSVQLLKDARFASYSVLAPAPDGHCVILGSMTGWLKVLTIPGPEFCVASSRSYEEQIHKDGKVYAINWLPTDIGTNDYQFLTSGPEGALTVWRLTFDPLANGHPVICMLRRHQFLLPYAKQRWVTAALLLAGGDIMVCGDRGGTVHVFRLSEQKPQQSFIKIHGKAGVTDIRRHGDCVYSCGRDGQFRKYSTNKDCLHLLSSNKVFKGFDWISRLLFRDEDMLILGFHTDQFIVYNVGRNQRLFSVSCGGGHRDWDFTLSRSGDGRFVFIKNKNVIVCDVGCHANQTILKPGVHGRELTDVKYLFSSADNSSVFLATASEDTTVGILQVTKSPTRDGQCRDTYQIVASMQAHISNVRALCVSVPTPRLDSEDILLFSAGGRAQLSAWRVYFHEGTGRQVRESGEKKEGSVSVGGDGNRQGGGETWGIIGQNVPVSTREGEQDEGGNNTVNSCQPGHVNRIGDNTSLKTGDNMSLKTGDNVSLKTGDNVSLKTGDNVSLKTGDNVSLKTGDNVSLKTGDNVSLKTGDNVSLKTGDNVSLKTGDNVSLKTGDNVSLKTGDNVSLKTGDNVSCCKTGDSVTGCDIQTTETSPNCTAIFTTPPESTQVTPRPVTRGATCWHKHLTSHMLLQPGRRHRKPRKKTACHPGPETRYMSVCVVSPADLDRCLCPLVHIVTTACSDGYIRLFRFDESGRCFSLIGQSHFHDHCVLIVKHFTVITSSNQRQAYILSAGTDGRIAFWDITDIAKKCMHSEEKHSSTARTEEFEQFPQGLKQTSTKPGVPGSHTLNVEHGLPESGMADSQDATPPERNTETGKDFPPEHCDECDSDGNDMTSGKEFPVQLEPVFVLDAHQSGVNAVDVKIIKEGSSSRYIVGSGGDDNALFVAVLSTTETSQGRCSSLVLLDATRIPAAHSAQITGVKFLDDNTIVTSSIDQRVTTWTVVMQPNLRLQMRASRCTSVSDAVGLDVFTDRNGSHQLAVCGVGLQCLELT